uniref:Uncharacterized protein n=1 Tax=Acrobeloides nanus TaxID=290746 RepID=A0A914D6X3_9BILA
MSNQYEERSPLHCTYKFDSNAAEIIDKNIDDVDMGAAAVEAGHHQFFGWHKAVLICMIVSLCTCGMAIFCGICAPCSPSCSLIFSILAFVSFITSAGALGVFFFAAHRVDIRFVQGLVATYE